MLSVYICSILFFSCTPSTEKRQVALYNSYCASCHIAPDIDMLPKHLWATEVLPDMAARLGIYDSSNHPYNSLTFNEQLPIIKSGVYPTKPLIAIEDWQLLKSYILNLAPDSLAISNIKNNKTISQFKLKPMAIDSLNGSDISYMGYDDFQNKLITGSMQGVLSTYDFKTDTSIFTGQYGNTISDYTKINNSVFVTSMGNIYPSEVPSGSIYRGKGANAIPMSGILHRPVHTVVHDLNNNGREELVVSEFGDLTGKLSILIQDTVGDYKKEILLQQPGIIRTIIKDMNNDDKKDLIIMSTQGDEGITILYQMDNLKFRLEKVIRFPPIYGSSWFELFDYDNDGDDDIVTVHGDNADDTFIKKRIMVCASILITVKISLKKNIFTLWTGPQEYYL